jgi:hypothetical protein
MNKAAGLGSNDVSHRSNDKDEQDVDIAERLVLEKRLQHRTDRGLEETAYDEGIHHGADANAMCEEAWRIAS